MSEFTTPILLLLFNRPDTTQKVFEAIRKVRPKELFISADGPREGRPGDAKHCQAAREIIKQVDWDCKLYTNFSDENMGCKVAISSGITWFFEHVEEGIILEDDCLPDQSFFTFCQQLLETYRNDTRVMIISGNNFQDGQIRGDGSYYFSKIATIWGWATWRRAWQKFDLSLNSFPEFKKQKLICNVFSDHLSRVFWQSKIEAVYDGGNSWAFPWVYTLLINNALCVVPNVNLVSNIGFGTIDAVHANDKSSKFSNIAVEDIGQLVHPKFVLPDSDADAYFSKILSKEQSIPTTPIYRIKQVIRQMISEANWERLRSLKNVFLNRR
jgi:hypothetical protein